MATLASILAAIGAISAIVTALFEMWKKGFMKTPQDKIDESNAKTDKEEQDFKDGKGGGDLNV
jgi:hypothetical protein